MAPSRNRMQPLVALSALRRLIANPQRTDEVFSVIRALSGPALENAYTRFATTETGRKILAEDTNLLDTLLDRKQLSQHGPNTLAHHYLNFVTTENITADGLVEASEDSELQDLKGGIHLFGCRQRDMHDLWHTMTQYGTDELGEVCLLAFTYAQTRNRGVGVICLTGCFKLAKFYGTGVFAAAWRAYKDGKRAAWLPAQDWEALLSQPIAEVRRALQIKEPDNYRELRAEFAVAS